MSRKPESTIRETPDDLARRPDTQGRTTAGHHSAADSPGTDHVDGASYSTAERWWETPLGRERLAYELAELDRCNIRWERDEESFAAGIARLVLYHEFDAKTERLVVIFPDYYPFFRFEIEAPDRALEHHQHPFGKALCLMGRATDNWHTSYTVAEIVTSQLPKTIAAGMSDDRQAVTGLEEHQAEPFSDYYDYRPSMIQVDGAWHIPPSSHFGTLMIGLVSVSHGVAGQPPWMHGIVLEVRGESGAILAEAAPAVRERYGRVAFEGRWSRSEARLESNNPSDVFARGATLDGDAKSLRWESFPHAVDGMQIRLQIRGVLFPEEVAWRESGNGWVFVVRVERTPPPIAGSAGAATVRGGDSKFIPRSGKPQGRMRARRAGPKVDTYFSRAGRSGPNDLAARVPELAPLHEATIAIFGLGTLGAPSTLEFARGGARELRILDDDIVDPATSVRWPLGMLAAGQLKSHALQAFIAEHYPHTSVMPMPHRLGAARNLGGVSDVQAMAFMTHGVSLIYDATAEFGVQHFLSEYARGRGISYVAVTGTQGGWGGRVVRIRPGITAGCWSCLQAARLDGTLPEPATKPVDGVQPAGCANPTFTGAGFDMLDVALHGVRLAVSTICGGRPGAYPPAEWDVAIISHRSADGAQLLPTVQFLPLDRHPACPACAIRDATTPCA